jgi:acyl-coenzyme A synthetase/AMP-(fatty) acid ligase
LSRSGWPSKASCATEAPASSSCRPCRNATSPQAHILIDRAVGGKRAVTHVAVEERLGARAMGEALRRHLAPALDATLLPKRFRFVKELPVSERGKVVPQALAKLFARGA